MISQMFLRDLLKTVRYLLRSKRNIYTGESVLNKIKEDDKNIQVSKNEIVYKRHLLNGPNLRDFFKAENLKQQDDVPIEEIVPYLNETNCYGKGRKVFFEVHGCQMNVNDTEIVWSILKANNFLKTDNILEANIVLLVTCAIRESAETKIWNRIQYINSLQRSKKRLLGSRPIKIGILGCMAERLKEKVLEIDKSIDLVAGPDSYRDLPRLLALTDNNQSAVNVLLSFDETYADVMPVRLNENTISAFVSIMRGCDNMCTYCIVPFTRGKERSRPIDSILDEVKLLRDQGVKEITLLGQNVNSYRDLSKGLGDKTATHLVQGFKTVYKAKVGGLRFAELLEEVADIDPEMRIRFTSPHPKDFPDEVLQVIRAKPNICRSLHLPAQSGNSAVLERMRRGYTRDSYMQLIEHVRSLLPDVALSSDFICGFCGETDEEFEDTITLMETVKYNTAFMFLYSMREKTAAHRRYKDDVVDDVKRRRLTRMIEVYRRHAEQLNRQRIGTKQLVLVEGESKRSTDRLVGRSDSNIRVILPNGDLPERNGISTRPIKSGDYVVVQISDANSQILKGIPLYHSTLIDFYNETNISQDNYYDKYINVL